MKKIAIALLLSACAQTVPVPISPSAITQADKAAIDSGVRFGLKDPASLKLRNVSAYQMETGDRVICGQFNGKNSFGAYAGFTPFYLRVRGGEVIKRHTPKVTDELYQKITANACKEAASGTIYINP